MEGGGWSQPVWCQCNHSMGGSRSKEGAPLPSCPSAGVLWSACQGGVRLSGETGAGFWGADDVELGAGSFFGEQVGSVGVESV